MKTVLKIILIIFGILGVVIISVLAAAFYTGLKPSTVVNDKLVFQNKLTIPPLLKPKEENGEKVFDLKIQTGDTAILPGKKTQTLGFNGSILGPTIRARTGDAIRMNVTNTLGETTTVHWHGMHLPAAMDGGPHQQIESGKTWQPNWTITNEAATLWYHPHLMEKTGEQVYRGLAGFFIIDDDNADSLALPKEYAVDDIPLVVQDRKFNPAGQLVYDHNHQNEITAGMLGNTILVNGTYAPYATVPAKFVRLRLLNGSNARRYNFGFSDNHPFYQIATDGGLLPSPIKKTRLQLSPGERAEIVVDLSEQTKPLTLMSYDVVGDTNKIRNFVFALLTGGTDERQQFKILELRPEPQSGDFPKQELPQKLNTITRLHESDAVKTRIMKLDSAAINGKKMDMARIDEIVQKGDIEIWTIRNESPVYHPVHIHGVQFQVLDSDEKGWKDTISVLPAETVRVIMKFTGYSDQNSPYMFHCHILEHEDMGMMGQFVVMDKDTKREDIHIKNDTVPENHKH